MKLTFLSAAVASLLLAGPIAAEQPIAAEEPLAHPADLDSGISYVGSPASQALNTLSARGCIAIDDCPDSRFGVDVAAQWTIAKHWRTFLRWSGQCGCSIFEISDGGCKTFSICSGTHSVCFDWKRGRGHWWDPSGHKTCYSLDAAYYCNTDKWQVWPTAEIECTW